MSASRAGKLFENRSTKKYYLAVLRDHVTFEVADIQFDVGKFYLSHFLRHFQYIFIQLRFSRNVGVVLYYDAFTYY